MEGENHGNFQSSIHSRHLCASCGVLVIKLIRLTVSRCRICDVPLGGDFEEDPFRLHLPDHIADGDVATEFYTECTNHASIDPDAKERDQSNSFLQNVTFIYRLSDEPTPKENNGGLETA